LISKEGARFDINTMLIIITPSWSERLVSSVVQVKGQQGVVVAVLIDPLSFGKTGENNNTARSLALRGVQVYIVNKGDNLASALDSRRLTTSNVL
jgi:hypothetical protein